MITVELENFRDVYFPELCKELKLGLCKAGTVTVMYAQYEVITSVYSCSVNRKVWLQESEYSRDDKNYMVKILLRCEKVKL